MMILKHCPQRNLLCLRSKAELVCVHVVFFKCFRFSDEILDTYVGNPRLQTFLFSQKTYFYCFTGPL